MSVANKRSEINTVKQILQIWTIVHICRICNLYIKWIVTKKDRQLPPELGDLFTFLALIHNTLYIIHNT